MDTKGIAGVGLLLIVGGFAVAVGFMPTMGHHFEVQEHEPTTATIQSTDIDSKEDDDGTSYRPVVVYEYTIEGETYETANVFPGRFTRWQDDRSWATGITEQYSPGQQVTVHYNPQSPGKAYLRNDGMPSSWFVGAGYGAVALLGGGWYVWVGFNRRKQRELMEDTPTESLQSLAVGRSEITGTAIAQDRDPVDAPFSEEACFVAKYEIEQYEEDDDDDGGSWKTIEEDVRHTPFYVDDGTDTVLVQPDDEATYDLDPADWSETYVDSSDRGPPPIREFVRNSSNVDFPADRSGRENDRKYRQNLIRTAESVFVYGSAQPRDVSESKTTNAGRLVVQKPTDGRLIGGTPFIISDDTEQSLINRREWALWRLPVGILFLAGGFAILVGTFGPLAGVRVPVLF